MSKVSIFQPLANSINEISSKVKELSLEAAIERAKYVEKYFASDSGENISLRRLTAIKDAPLSKTEQQEDELSRLFAYEDVEIERRIFNLKKWANEKFFRDSRRRIRLHNNPMCVRMGFFIW